jgi:hypothetical protein
MGWAKFDDKYLTNRKIMQAGLEARALHQASIIYCAGELTDGLIPGGVIFKLCALSDIVNVESTVDRLVELNLYEKTDAGYMVHDYLDYNPSREQVLKTRAVRAEAGARGGKQKASNLLEVGQTFATNMTKQNSTPSRTPSPSPLISKDLTGDDPIEGEERASAQPAPPESTSSSSSSDSSRATSFPANFKITPEMEVWAARNLPELDVGPATDEWEASMRANREKHRYTDWKNAWFAAMRKADKWQRERGGSKNGTANGHRVVGGEPGRVSAKSRQNEASAREEMEWRAHRQARGDPLEIKAGG